MDNICFFKGKRIDNGEWICGSCAIGGDELFRGRVLICPSIYTATCIEEDGFMIGKFIEVDLNTICRCTGFTANKSYRGESPEDKLIFEYDYVMDNRGVIGIITYERNGFSIKWNYGEYNPDLNIWLNDIKIIGTKFEEELL